MGFVALLKKGTFGTSGGPTASFLLVPGLNVKDCNGRIAHLVNGKETRIDGVTLCMACALRLI
jgi:hypothetical protein